MRLKKICRIESYPNSKKYGYSGVCDWGAVYFLDMRYNRKDWYDENYEPIENPLYGYKISDFYKTVNEIWKMDKHYRRSGTYVEDNQEEEFDIMFEDDGIFPYNCFSGDDVYEEIDRYN